MCALTGGREVELIGTPERDAESPIQNNKTPPDQRVSCRALGEVDHEGWLAKKGKRNTEAKLLVVSRKIRYSDVGQ